MSIILLFLVCISVTIFLYGHATALTQTSLPKSLTNNFGKDPKISRNFTWYTSSSVKKGVLEYCAKNKFKGFDKANVIKVMDESYETKTYSDKREIHKVELNNLKPGIEYVYRVGDQIGGFSTQSVFKTAEQDLQKFIFISITDTQGATQKDYALWKNT